MMDLTQEWWATPASRKNIHGGFTVHLRVSIASTNGFPPSWGLECERYVPDHEVQGVDDDGFSSFRLSDVCAELRRDALQEIFDVIRLKCFPEAIRNRGRGPFNRGWDW